MKKIYWKEIRQSFSHSKGRVISIVSLMALGSFTLVGLKVTGPDMEQTGQHFFKKHHTADLAVLSDYGLDKKDQEKLNSLSQKADVEYGYFQDVVVKDSNTAFRIFSKPETVSTYELDQGTLPKKEGEIAIASFYQDRYQLGDYISFEEKENRTGKKTLKKHDFKIVGFVHSSEMLSRVNLGPSTAGSGNLSSYGVVVASQFDSPVYMVARLSYKDVYGKNPYSQSYLDRMHEEKKQVESLLAGQATTRLSTLKEEANHQINQGQQSLEDAKSQLKDAENQLQAGRQQLLDGEAQVSAGRQQLQEASQGLEVGSAQLSQARQTLDSSYQELVAGQEQLELGRSQLAENQLRLTEAERALDEGKTQLHQTSATLTSVASQLAIGQTSLDEKSAELQAGKTQLDQTATELSQAREQLDQMIQTLAGSQAELDQAKAELETKVQLLLQEGVDPTTVAEIQEAQERLSQQEKEWREAQELLFQKEAEYQAGAQLWASKEADYQVGLAQLDEAKADFKKKEADYQAGLIAYHQGLAEWTNKQLQYQASVAQWEVGRSTLATKEGDYQTGLARYQAGEVAYADKWAQYQNGLASLYEGQALLNSKEAELAEGKNTLEEKEKEFQKEKPKAEEGIEQGEKELAEGKERLAQLDLPSYKVYSRREIPGSDGYISYENNANIIDSVGNIFPVVLYFVAALVTFTTMARFVDEERLKSGTFKALGYQNHDIMRKFIIYGLVTGFIGTAIGTLAGHILLPKIIYGTYSKNIYLAPLELHFYPKMTLLSILLALLSAVLPAYLVARKELTEHPAQLLLPKPPANGSKILLERIKPLWSRMSFTQKVTARNIFRYKQRMLMTIFGVSGSVALLFGGLGIRSSIADLNQQQFGQIIRYDMIVAEKNHLTTQEQLDVKEALSDSAISSHMPLHYESLSKVAGDKKDEQKITTLVIGESQMDHFSHYIKLSQRGKSSSLSLRKDGVILSEKLATLLKVKVGDSFTIKDSQGKDVTLRVAGISEMYMGHFLFMSQSYYQKAFGQAAPLNAYLVNLKEDSETATQKEASRLMSLSGVQGVVQNTQLKEQVHAIVDSLNRIMYVMIIVSVLLAAVILYNLTNINVAERIRELSTIKVLGFYNKEVTLYIYRESIYLSLLGILVGFGMGMMLHRYMLAIIPPDTVMFNPSLSWSIYVLPATVILLILALLGFIVNRWLQKVDMLEALKSVE